MVYTTAKLYSMTPLRAVMGLTSLIIQEAILTEGFDTGITDFVRSVKQYSYLPECVLTLFRWIGIFVNTSLSKSTTNIYYEFQDKNVVNQALHQYMRKKPLIDWQSRNQ